MSPRTSDSRGWLRGMPIQGGARVSPGSRVELGGPQRAIVAWADGREADCSAEGEGVV